MFRSRFLRVAVGVAISLAFLFLAVNKIEFSRFLTALVRTNILSALMCIGFFIFSCVFRTIMWRVTTQVLGKVGFPTLFGGVVVGYMANNILPLRAGEMIRAHFLTSRAKIPLTSTFATVCIERILDILSLGLLMILGIACGIQGLTFQRVKIILIGLGAFFLLSVPIILLMIKLDTSENHCNNSLSRFLDMLRRFLKPLKQLKQGKTFIIVMTLSIAAWISNYLSILALIYQIIPDYLKSALLLLLFINVGLLIPSSPGALGVMQVAFWMALSPFGITREDSLALSFVYQGGLYLFTLSVGMPYFLKANIRLKDVEKQRSILLG